MQRQKSHKTIEERAYELWDHAGRPNGQSLDYWLQAERELSAGPATAKPRKPRAKRSSESGESLKQPVSKVTRLKPRASGT